MKYQQTFIHFCILFYTLTIFHNIAAVLTMSQYKPDSTFEKPYFTQDYFANATFKASGGSAAHAYTTHGNQVSFMQQFGTEDLLQRFINPTLPEDDISSMGQGLLNGEFHVREIILGCYKNIKNGFFIEAATTIQDLSIDSITVNYAPSPSQITDEQTRYLQTLQQCLPSSMNRAGMFTTAIFTGFHTTFLNFNHLDFIDLQIKLGIMSPQAMSNNNFQLLQFPFIGNYNFGYPAIVTASCGVLDWLTIGANAAAIPWQSTTATFPMNNTFSHNNLLVTETGVAILERGPLFTGALYLEADHFYHGLSITAAYCYTRNCQYTLTPINQTQFPKALINQSPLLNGWNLSSLYFQFDVDFAYEITPSAPVLTLLCNLPIAGQLCPQTNIFGGSCSLQISYAF